MKKIVILLVVLNSFGVFAQNKIAQDVATLLAKKTVFHEFAPFTEKVVTPQKKVTELIDKATYVSLQEEVLNQILEAHHETILIDIPYQGATIQVQLFQVHPLAEGFHVDTDQHKNVEYQKGLFYRGIVKGNSNSVVSFNFFKSECNGIISSNQLSNLVVGKMKAATDNSEYIIYKDADLKIKNTFDCTTKNKSLERQKKNPKNLRNIESTRCATIYFEIDFNLFQSNNNDVVETTNWMTALFNNVQTLYANDGISVAIKSIYVWTTQDPYEGIGTTSADYLYKFHDFRPVFDGDLGQLVGIDPGGLGGVAVTIDGLCSNNNFSYSDVSVSYSNVPTYSWDVEVITHELGHLLGSPHTHGCYWNGDNTAIDGCGQQAGYHEGSCADGTIPDVSVKGTIMSYCHLISGVGISFNNGFGPQPAAAILNAVNSGTCLSTDCINTCINNITAVNASAITDFSATINWTEIGGGASSEISVFPLSAGSGSWNTPSSPSFNVSGLTPNTYYKALVRNNCSAGLIGSEQSLVFATTGDFCSGIPLTDTGGPNGNYQDFETIIRTILPVDPNAKAKITFTSFDLELNYDYLFVYDGHDTSFPEVSNGGFTGTTIPAPIESTATDGALTIKFTSDGGVVAAGYEATVSCLNLASTNFLNTIDFSYYPNPSHNAVVLNSNSKMTELQVFNVEGRLLWNQKTDTLSQNVDISNFEIGTYFFKVKFGEKEMNFKVLKL